MYLVALGLAGMEVQEEREREKFFILSRFRCIRVKKVGPNAHRNVHVFESCETLLTAIEIIKG